MVKCSFEGCDADFEVHRMNRDLCKKHYRFMNMQTRARCSGLAVPSFDQLEAVVPDGMSCPDCGKIMGWLLKEVGYSQMATLQHYRSGEFGIVCGACNTKHHYMPGDSYRDLPDGHKWCRDCDTIKPHNEFWANNGERRSLKVHVVCIPCGKKRNEKMNSKRRPNLLIEGAAGIDLRPDDIQFLNDILYNRVPKWSRKHDATRKRAREYGLAKVIQGTRTWVVTDVGKFNLARSLGTS